MKLTSTTFRPVELLRLRLMRKTGRMPNGEKPKCSSLTFRKVRRINYTISGCRFLCMDTIHNSWSPLSDQRVALHQRVPGVIPEDDFQIPVKTFAHHPDAVVRTLNHTQIRL